MATLHRLFLTALALSPALLSAEIHHAQGEMAGEVTATSAWLQTRLTAIPGPELDADGDVPGMEGVACFEWSETPDFSQPIRSKWSVAKAERDFIIRSSASGLKPGTLYHLHSFPTRRPSDLDRKSVV